MDPTKPHPAPGQSVAPGPLPEPPVIVPQSIAVRTPHGPPPTPKRSRRTGWIFLAVILGVFMVAGYFVIDAAFRWVPRLLGGKEAAPAPAEEALPPPEEPAKPARPKPVAPKKETAPPPEAPAPAVDPAKQQADRARAEEALGELIAAQRALVEAGVAEWGDALYEEVLALSKSGDEAMIQPDYASALGSYEDALERCERLAEMLPEALKRMLREGDAALEATDGALALRKYGAALQLDPESDAARAGVQRARTIEEVSTLLQAGAAKEAEGRLALALGDYQEAVELDPLSREAAAGVERLSAGIRQSAFQELMSRGLAALKAGQLDEAQTLIQKARDLDATSPAVQEAMAQVEEARRVARIRQMEQSARDAERREGWSTALGLYESILKIDPLIRSAQEGRDRAQVRVRLQAEMTSFLAAPDLLETEEGRKKAAEALDAARGLSGGAPEWTRQVASLDALLKKATTPIAVTLRSDGQTRVDVYKVGRFPPFQTKALPLLPGRYTVVGHRPGFRDVRLELLVDAGLEPIETEVICRDPIR